MECGCLESGNLRAKRMAVDMGARKEPDLKKKGKKEHSGLLCHTVSH